MIKSYDRRENRAFGGHRKVEGKQKATVVTHHLQVKWGVTGGDFCCGRFLQTNQVVIIFVHFLHVQFPTGRNGQSIVIEPNQIGRAHV